MPPYDIQFKSSAAKECRMKSDRLPPLSPINPSPLPHGYNKGLSSTYP